MILDGLEGDPSVRCDATGWYLCCGLRKIQLARSRFWDIIQATNQLTKDPNQCFPTITIDLDTSNG
jgi:hypothetical protein